jgi:hypothetical protein
MAVQINQGTAHNHTLVITTEKALELERRSRPVEEEIDKLIARRSAQQAALADSRPEASRGTPERTVEAEVIVPEPQIR